MSGTYSPIWVLLTGTTELINMSMTRSEEKERKHSSAAAQTPSCFSLFKSAAPKERFWIGWLLLLLKAALMRKVAAID